MAKIAPPSVTKKIDMAIPQPPKTQTVMLQIRVSEEVRDQFKIAVARSEYKNMTHLFEAMLNEYSATHFS